MKEFKVTPFICGAPLAIILFVLYRYYYVQSWSLITLLAIGVFVLNLTILVIIDRFLILWVKLKYLWYIETLIIAIFVLLKAWESFLLWPLL